MAHFGTLFVKKSPPLSPSQRKERVRSKLERSLTWFLDHNDWQQALAVVQQAPRWKQSRKLDVGRNSKNVVTPHHYKTLLSSCSSPPPHLLEHVRTACAADEIPNSPGLYQALVDAYCRSGWPASAVEVAAEGNMRWRFDQRVREGMAVSILKNCASIQPRHPQIWQTALDCVQQIVLTKQQSGGGGGGGAVQNRETIRALVAKCAVRSGNAWEPFLVSGEEKKDDAVTAEEASTTIWGACRSAAMAGQWKTAMSLFQKASASSSSSALQLSAMEGAPHELANRLGADGKWQECLAVVQLVAEKTQSVDGVLSNLVFASLPPPKSFAKSDKEDDKAAAATSAVAQIAVDVFESWMSNLDQYSPPALTCALVTGFFADLFESSNNQEDLDNCAQLLAAFSLERNPNIRLDTASHEAVLKAVAALEAKLSSKETDISRLTFPSPGYDRVAALRELANYRAQRWQKSLPERSGGAVTRPNRVDYFPLARKSATAVDPALDDIEDRRRALEAAHAAGAAAFPLAGDEATGAGGSTATKQSAAAMAAGEQRPSVFRTARQQVEHDDAFLDPRPAPLYKNDRASGYNYFGMGGDPIFPRGSKVATMANYRPKRFKNLHNLDRSWRGSTPRATQRHVAKGYKHGTPI